MAKQLVVSGNRILAYGEDCFAVMGEIIKCSTTGEEYTNATVTTCEEFPKDIGKVGYEYHAGQFVPCAPFGEGEGNIAVFCDACNTLKNSGFSISDLYNPAHIYETSYTGANKYGSSNPNSKVTLPFIAKMLFVMHGEGDQMGVIFNNGFGISFSTSDSSATVPSLLKTDLSTVNPTWYSTDSKKAQLNESVSYTVIALG